MKTRTMIFALIIAFSFLFAGCDFSQCDHAWERTNDYESGSILEKCLKCDEERTITITGNTSSAESVLDDQSWEESLTPNTESKFPANPSSFLITGANSAVYGSKCTYSWTAKQEDGTTMGIEADSDHPLELIEYINAIKVSEGETLTFTFEALPTSITVKRYELTASDYSDYVNIPVNDGCIVASEGDYLYEVVVRWEGDASYGGIVYYAFRTEK